MTCVNILILTFIFTLSVLHTLSVRATWRWLTWVRTWHTSLWLTHVSCVTVWVTCTLWSTASDGVRFRDQSWLTSADGVSWQQFHLNMIDWWWFLLCVTSSPTSKINCTYSSWSTGWWVARIWFLNTFLILADVATTTVRVNDTLRFTSRDGIRVGYQTRLTSADGITWPGYWTVCSRSTWGGVTGVRFLNTSLVLTNVSPLTIWISHTLRFTSRDGVRVWDQSRLTSTDGIASSCHWALSSRSTRVGITGVRFDNTSSSLTNVSLLAVRVNDTFWSTTCDGVRFWDQTRFTGTDGIACWVHIAPSSRSTGIGLAGIRFGSTSVGSADQTHPAVRINDALRFATCDGIRVWSEPRYTSTLWVSISVDCTGCTWSTRSRVTGVHLTWCSYTQMRRSTTSKPMYLKYDFLWIMDISDLISIQLSIVMELNNKW